MNDMIKEVIIPCNVVQVWLKSRHFFRVSNITKLIENTEKYYFEYYDAFDKSTTIGYVIKDEIEAISFITHSKEEENDGSP